MWSQRTDIQSKHKNQKHEKEKPEKGKDWILLHASWEYVYGKLVRRFDGSFHVTAQARVGSTWTVAC
jgi:hypothetical protein